MCRLFGRTRQAFHKRQRSFVKRSFHEHLIVSEVKRFRQRQPFVGVRKLHRMLQIKGFEIGRDRLFDLLRDEHMLIRRRRKYVQTTNSRHRFRKYSNLIREEVVSEANRVFVADITYIDTVEGFCYLSLITDVYSRKIVGYELSRSLASAGPQRALFMALQLVSDPEKLIHHSDRGIQYCCDEYVSILEKNKISISMTEEDHIYENALAERINGILKTEFMLGEKLQSFEIARKLVRESIRIYNQERLHMSLGYQTPEMRYAA